MGSWPTFDWRKAMACRLVSDGFDITSANISVLERFARTARKAGASTLALEAVTRLKNYS
jgi:hypothetical protein